MNHMKTVFRSLSRQKVYSIINILGLTLGLTSCLIIFLVVKYELGYDGFNKKADRIYRVTMNALDFNPSVSMAVTPVLRNDFPELKEVSQVWHQESGLVKVGQRRFNENNYLYADEHFARIFDYEWLAGDEKSALSQPGSVVLTKSISEKYFGDENPMGKTINLDNKHDLKVTGLIKDVPGNTHLPFLFAVSFKTIENDVANLGKGFYNISGASTYILLNQNQDVKQLQQRMPGFIRKNWGNDIAKETKLILQPLKEIHFDQRYLNNPVSPTTSKQTYWALSAVAVFIILIACINFINLATAQALRRNKEVGVRKVLGSSRFQLVIRFLIETVLMVAIAAILSVIAVILLLPVMAHWLDIRISISQLADPVATGLLIALLTAVILITGIYPAFVQSAFSPVQSIRNQVSGSLSGITLRKSLVVVQFCISQMLIIGTLVVAWQMDFFSNRDLGFNKDAVITFDIPDKTKHDVLEQELLNNPGVKAVSFSSGAPGYNRSFGSFTAPDFGLTKADVTELKFIDEKYTTMFGLKMIAGEDVRPLAKGDSLYKVVVNETMLQKLHIKSPEKAIGQSILLGDTRVMIAGVMKDFQSESKHKLRRSCVLLYSPDTFYSVSVKLQPGGMAGTIKNIDKTWSALFPAALFSYEFLDEHIAGWYRQEQKQYIAFKLFSGIAIFIGCLGLYGLMSFSTVQRKKEVGVRRVLGASLNNIVFMFSKEFVMLIIIAFIIAAPVSYMVMNNWLQNFAYHISISWWMFFIAACTAGFIAFFTISFQAIKAALANPVKSLRSE